MLGIKDEETKHEMVVGSLSVSRQRQGQAQEPPSPQRQPASPASSRQQQPLTQKQVLQHLSTLQRRMGQIQSFAKGLSDQAQQDKIKIRTLEQQLEAAKTLQWAKQTVWDSPKAVNDKQKRRSVGDDLPPPVPLSHPPHPRAPVSTPRLEQIRKARQEREAKLRVQFSNSTDVNDMAKAELEHNNDELEAKLHTLEQDYEMLQNSTNQFQTEKANLLLEHTEALSSKQAIIHTLEEEMKGLENLIEDSYQERESLQKKLIKTTNKKNALDVQLEVLEENAKDHRLREKELSFQLLKAQDTEEKLRKQQINQSLEALIGQEEQDQLIQQLQSLVKKMERKSKHVSFQPPPQHSIIPHNHHANQMQREHEWGKDVLELNCMVERLKKQLQDQEHDFHQETIEMEVELMDAEEFGRMQVDMLEVQEMELLLLSNALEDLKKDHPLSKSESGDDLFAISEEDGDVDKSIQQEEEENEEEEEEEEETKAQHQPAQSSQVSEKEEDKDEDEENAAQAYLKAQHCNIYLLSRKFEWQLQRREQLEVRLETMSKKYDALADKYTEANAELAKKEAELEAKEAKESASSTATGATTVEGTNGSEAGDDAENKESLSRALMRASMSIRSLQQELKTSQKRTTQLETELEKMAPTNDSEKMDDKSTAALQARLEEEAETNELLKEFMEDLKDSHAKEKEEWETQQQELNQKIALLSQQIEKDQVGGQSSDEINAMTPAKKPQAEPLLIASPPKTPLRQEWMTEISIVRSEISRLKRTLHSSQPQNESFLGALNESGSQQSDDYIFDDGRSDDENINDEETRKGRGSISPSERWYQEVSALKQELNDLTVELRNKHDHDSKQSVTPPSGNWRKGVSPLKTGPGFEDASSVDSSTTGGFENEIQLLREEVDRQQEQRKTAVSPYSAVSSAGSSSPQVHPAGSSLVSSLEDSSFSEYIAFSEI